MAKKAKSTFAEINFSAVHNRNESRVLKELKKIYADLPKKARESKAIQDIYALALNSLPARYTQPGSIVLRDPVRVEHIQAALREAVEMVAGRPKK
jgi:hypothetical protein